MWHILNIYRYSFLVNTRFKVFLWLNIYKYVCDRILIFFNSYPPVLFAEVFLGKCMLKMEEQKNYLFMDKEENVFKISEFISKSLSDCLEEGELQELEK